MIDEDVLVTILLVVFDSPSEIRQIVRRNPRLGYRILAILQCLDIAPTSLSSRFILFDDDDLDACQGRNVFTYLCARPMLFYDLSGVIPETFLQIYARVRNKLQPSLRRRSPMLINRMNMLLMTLIWLKSYPTYCVLAAMFEVSYRQVSRVINTIWPILYEEFCDSIHWPTHREWSLKRGRWGRLPDAVGAIDGTSHEILMPGVEPQQIYFSGYRRYHCIHTQVVIDNECNIVLVESGFLGHNNDAQMYRMMGPLGIPRNCYLLGDCIYPSRHPIVTPYTAAQLARMPHHIRRRSRRLNRHIRKYRVMSSMLFIY